jgi:NADPH2:quinone reductase
MRVVRFDRYGDPEVLHVVEEPTPEPGPDQLLVEVRAAGVNPVDWKIRKGLRVTEPLTAPRGLGSDAAGVVVALGEDAEGFAVGDDVIVSGATDAYASHLLARARQLTAKPSALNWEAAAGFGIPVGTAYQVLRSLQLTAGEMLLVHGGSGGVGQAAIQLARAWGADVVATANVPNHERLRELGAIPVEYGPGLLERLRDAAPDGYDVVLDAAGTEEAFATSLDLVADRSRIATIVDVQRADELGIRAWSGSRPGYLTEAERQLRFEAIGVVATLAEEGRFEVEIAARYPLDEASAAHEFSETGHVRGKIVLLP